MRQANIREKEGPSLGKIQVNILHQRSPYAIKFEDRSREETERTRAMCPKQGLEPCQKHIEAERERQNYILLAHGKVGIPGCVNKRGPKKKSLLSIPKQACTLIVNKNLNEAELEPVGVSKNPKVVMTASGEMPAKEEATVYVRELDLFLTVKLLENTPAVLSLGKLCEDHGLYLPLDQRSKTTTHQKSQENSLRRIKSCTIRRTWFVHGVPLPHRLLLHLHRLKLD